MICGLGVHDYLIGCKLNFSTLGPLIRQSILKVSTFISLGFGPVRFRAELTVRFLRVFVRAA